MTLSNPIPSFKVTLQANVSQMVRAAATVIIELK